MREASMMALTLALKAARTSAPSLCKDASAVSPSPSDSGRGDRLREDFRWLALDDSRLLLREVSAVLGNAGGCTCRVPPPPLFHVLLSRNT